jgi:hypothetical protein
MKLPLLLWTMLIYGLSASFVVLVPRILCCE